MLPLDGRVIDAATYPDLVARIGTQLPDVRGLFLRAAGASSWYTMANGAPYDGKGIREFIGDAFQGHWHIMSSTSPVSVTRPSSVFIQRPTSGFALVINVSVPDTGSTELPVKYISDLVNGAPRTAAETRPASIGVYVCITY
jgi:hypothetical protein